MGLTPSDSSSGKRAGHQGRGSWMAGRCCSRRGALSLSRQNCLETVRSHGSQAPAMRAPAKPVLRVQPSPWQPLGKPPTCGTGDSEGKSLTVEAWPAESFPYFIHVAPHHNTWRNTQAQCQEPSVSWSKRFHVHHFIRSPNQTWQLLGPGIITQYLPQCWHMTVAQ